MFSHGVTANSLYLSFSPCKATKLTSLAHIWKGVGVAIHIEGRQDVEIKIVQNINHTGVSSFKAVHELWRKNFMLVNYSILIINLLIIITQDYF